MSEKALREHLNTLHAELEATPTVDPALRKLLRETVRDIQEALDRPGPTQSPSESESFADRLTETLQHFEAEHPALGAALRRVTNALSDLGI